MFAVSVHPPAEFQFRRCLNFKVRPNYWHSDLLTLIMPRARVQHNPFRFSCNYCARTFTTQSGIKRHVRQIHPRPPPALIHSAPSHNSRNDNDHGHDNIDDADACLLRSENIEVPAVARVEHHRGLNGKFFFYSERTNLILIKMNSSCAL